MTIAKRSFIYVLLSLLILLLPVVSLTQGWIDLPVWFQTNLPHLPYAIVALGLILCWVFHNSREFNLLLILGICYWSLQNYFWTKGLPIAQREFLFSLLCLLIPINFVINDFLKERGILNRHGIKRLVFIALQITAVIWVILTNKFELSNYLNMQFYSHALLEKTIIKQPALVVMTVCMAILTIHWIIRPAALRGAWIMALAAIIIALHYVNNNHIATIYFLLAGIIIIMAIIMNSYNLAYKDELTRLPSRRALTHQLMSLGKKYAIAMVDVDHFKKLNDNYGHDVGDDVLKMLATRLNSVEGGGKAFRYGGEEFTLVFPDKSAKEAEIYLEALRVKIDTYPFMVRHKKRPRTKPEKPAKSSKTKLLEVTVSMGVAEKTDDHNSPQDVIKSADEALYKAKKKGRNRVVVA